RPPSPAPLASPNLPRNNKRPPLAARATPWGNDRTMTDTTAGRARASKAPAKPHFSEGYKRLVLALLVTAYTFNFIDRTIIATIGQAIKEDLKITDTQLGLLGGLYFALLYTFLGIPLARFAERVSRVNIISAAIVVWSV